MNDSEPGQSTTDRVASADHAAAVLCEVVHNFPTWQELGPLDDPIVSAVRAAAAVAGAQPGEIAVVLSGDEEVRRLNAQFRGVDAPTNVLSFPQDELPPEVAETGLRGWGDVVLAYETIMREAEEQQKPPLHHLCHLVVHGVLHLFGYTHDTVPTAEQMEALEIEALAKLGIPNPYADELSAA